MIRRHRSPLLFRYVMWNLCLVLVPVLVLISLYYQSANTQMKRDMENTRLHMLEQTVASTDERVRAFVSTASQISGDIWITPYLLRSSSYDSVEAINRIRIYSARLDYLDDFLLYIRGGDNLYSGRGVIGIPTFLDLAPLEGGWTRDDFMDFITQGNDFRILPCGVALRRAGRQNPSRLTLMVCPWSRSGSPAIGSVVALVDMSVFTGGMQSADGGVRVWNLILDRDGGVLYTDGGVPEGLNLGAGELPADGVTRRDALDCSVMSVSSSFTGWRYVTVLSHAGIGPDPIRYNSALSFALAGLVLACVFFGIFMAYRNWLPIYQLSQRFPPRRANSKNELALIGESMDALHAEREERDRLRAESRALVKQSLLYQLFTAVPDGDEDAFRDKLKASGIALDGPMYGVMTMTAEALTAPARAALLNRCAQETGVYPIDTLYRNYVTAVFSLGGVDDDAAGRLAASLRASCERELCFGLGLYCRSLSAVNRSLVESVLALETCMRVCPPDRIVRFDQMRSARTETFQPEMLSARILAQGVRQMNRMVIEKSLDSVRREMEGQSAYGDAVCLRYLTDTVAQQLIPLGEECGLADFNARLSGLIHYESLDRFMERLGALCGDLAEAYAQRCESSGHRQYLKVAAYLDAHFSDPEISLQLLADHFGMTVQYMSRFFRDHAGVNFIDFVTQKRMSLACELLMTTDEPIRVIVERVGYLNVPSFTRKFSEMYGITPGKYRQDRAPKANED